MSLKEAADQKKIKQDKMREALNDQLNMKKQIYASQANHDKNWMNQHMEKINKEILDDDMKKKRIR